MKVIPVANPDISEKEALAAYNVIKRGWISMGKEVSRMEKELSKILENEFVLLFNNGTSCLHAALLALNIKKGDEVIVPSLSYISSANAILYVGATPVFCDSDPNTFNTTAQMIEKKITVKLTKNANKQIQTEGFDKKMGARPLQRVINNRIKLPLSKKILFENIENQKLTVDFNKEEDTFTIT